MALWRREFDPFITTWPASSSSFLPIIFNPPNFPKSIHISVYLPTAGRDAEYLGDLAALETCIDELLEKHPATPVYLRGDFNTNIANKTRSGLLHFFLSVHGLKSVHIPHPTYHHFMGNGSSDSNLDCLLYSEGAPYPEILTDIICKLNNPLIDSHHDILISSFSLPHTAPKDTIAEDNVVAPRIDIKRTRTVWTESGIEQYCTLIQPKLSLIQLLWLDSPSPSTVALALQATTRAMTDAASATNKTAGSGKPCKSPPTGSRRVAKSQDSLLKRHRELCRVTNNDTATHETLKKTYKLEKGEHRKLIRKENSADSIKRDTDIFTIFDENPSKFFNKMRLQNRNTSRKISQVKVLGKTYTGENVPDGFYDHLSQLKTFDTSSVQDPASFSRYAYDYTNIIELSKEGTKIPEINLEKSN